MKRKLIAVALACALVFSMIPSLAFADEALPTYGGFTDMIEDLLKYDETEMSGGTPAGSQVLDMKNMTLTAGTYNYKDAHAKLVEYETAFALLEKIADDTSWDYYTKEQQESAVALETKIKTEKADFLPDDFRAVYDAKIVTDVNAEALKLGATADVIYKTADACATAMVPWYEALDTVDDVTTTPPTNFAKVERVVFIAALYNEITGLCEFVAADESATVVGMPSSTVVEAAVKAYPQYAGTITTSSFDADVTELTAGKITFSGTPKTGTTNVTLTGKGLFNAYTAVINGYNEDKQDAYNQAKIWMQAYQTARDVEKLPEAIKATRDALDAMTLTKVARDALLASDIWSVEAAYVDMLLHKDATISEKNEDAFVAATKAARAAYDKQVAFYEEAGEKPDFKTGSAAWTVLTTKLETAEADIVTYYKNGIQAAYNEVKTVTEITDENKADVKAFVEAYEKYESVLTAEEKIAIEKGENKIGEAYATKYAELKPLYDAEVEAEENAAQAEKDRIAQMEKDLADLKAQKDADAAEIAALEAQIAFLKAKVKNVKATAGKKKATVKWAKLDGAVKYKVFRATSRNGNFKAVKTTTNLRFVNKKLKSGNNYFYKVVAIDANGNQSKDSKIIRTKKIK